MITNTHTVSSSDELSRARALAVQLRSALRTPEARKALRRQGRVRGHSAPGFTLVVLIYFLLRTHETEKWEARLRIFVGECAPTGQFNLALIQEHMLREYGVTINKEAISRVLEMVRASLGDEGQALDQEGGGERIERIDRGVCLNAQDGAASDQAELPEGPELSEVQAIERVVEAVLKILREDGAVCSLWKDTRKDPRLIERSVLTALKYSNRHDTPSRSRRISDTRTEG